MSSASAGRTDSRAERGLEMREQRGAVRQPGERIVRRLVLQAALLRAPLADVAHDGGVQPFGVEPHAAHGDLHREHFAVQRARVALADHAVQRAEPRAGAVARQQRDELGDRLVDELVGGAAEQARRRGIRRLDDAGLVDADDAVGRRLHHALQQRVAPAHAERIRQARARSARRASARWPRRTAARPRAWARRCRAAGDRRQTRTATVPAMDASASDEHREIALPASRRTAAPRARSRTPAARSTSTSATCAARPGSRSRRPAPAPRCRAASGAPAPPACRRARRRSRPRRWSCRRAPRAARGLPARRHTTRR